MKPGEIFDSSMGRILTLIQKRRLLARYEIAEESGLTRTTVSKAVAALIDQGIVCEVERGQASSRGGPRPILLRLNQQAIAFIGFDIRREKVTAVRINLGGGIERILVTEMAPNAAAPDFLTAIESATIELRSHSAGPIAAIGVGSIGPVDFQAGVIRSTYFKPLEYLPIVEPLERKFAIPVALRVGSIMGAYGEERIAADKADRTPKSVAFIVIDYGGIGLGLISGSSAWLTDHAGVGELAHVSIDLNGRRCECGRKGCLVEYASGRVLVKQLGYVGRHGKSEHSLLAQVAVDAESGNARVQQAIVEAGEYLGGGIADIDRLLRPERIVIGSSHDHLAEWYMRGVHSYLKTLPESAGGPRLLDRLFLAESGSAAIAYGAAAMQLEHFIRSPSRVLDSLRDLRPGRRATSRSVREADYGKAVRV